MPAARDGCHGAQPRLDAIVHRALAEDQQPRQRFTAAPRLITRARRQRQRGRVRVCAHHKQLHVRTGKGHDLGKIPFGRADLTYGLDHALLANRAAILALAAQQQRVHAVLRAQRVGSFAYAACAHARRVQQRRGAAQHQPIRPQQQRLRAAWATVWDLIAFEHAQR